MEHSEPVALCCASMGPRTSIRGNVAFFAALSSLQALQWGRGLPSAETDRPPDGELHPALASMGPRTSIRGNDRGIRLAPSDRRASMGPRTSIRGNATSRMTFRRITSLQWGRGLPSAETSTRRGGASARRAGFNGAAGSSSDRFYFPILPDKKTFNARIDQWFPGLRRSAPAVVTVLEEVQPFQSDQEWLGQFNQVNNMNKHGDLVEQTRVESQRTKVTGQGGGQVSWGPGVTFGDGVSVMGVPVDPMTQLPVPHPSIKVERITWVDFQFAGIGVSAFGLLKQARAGIGKIEATVRPLL